MEGTPFRQVLGLTLPLRVTKATETMECVYGSTYPVAWDAPSQRETHLFDTEEECCEAWGCGTEDVGPSGEGRWLPSEDGADCVYLVLPAVMLDADFLYDTRETCCAANACVELVEEAWLPDQDGTDCVFVEFVNGGVPEADFLFETRGDCCAANGCVGGDAARPGPGAAAVAPSASPALPPDASPAAPGTPSPTGRGTPVGPVAVRHLTMTIVGEADVDVGLWSDAAEGHVAGYFDTSGVGAFGVDVEVKVTGVRYNLPPPGGTERTNLFAGTPPGLRRRGQEETASSVFAYEQTSTFVSLDPAAYDAVYVALAPFATSDGREAFAARLGEMGYGSIASVSVEYAPPPEATPTASEGNEADGGGPSSDDNGGMTGIIAGSVCGAALLVAAAALFVRRRRTAKRRHLEVVGNGYEYDLSLEVEEGGDVPTEPALLAGEKPAAADFGLAGAAPDWEPSPGSYGPRPAGLPSDGGTEELVHVVAPAGKLGVIVDMPPTGPPAFVCEVKDSSPLLDEIFVGDKIVAVDGEDVQTMSAVNVSKLLGRKSRNEQRRITVLRERDGLSQSSDEADADFSPPSSPSSRPSVEAGGVASPPGSDAGFDDGEVEVQRLDILAPAGKLGVVLVTPDEPTTAAGDRGSAYVFNIREDSPLLDAIQLGDRVVEVDGRDVSDMTAIDVSRLLGSKAAQESRRITVLREVGNFDDIGDVDGVRGGSAPDSQPGPVPTEEVMERTNGVDSTGEEDTGVYPPESRRGSDASGGESPRREAGRRPPLSRAAAEKGSGASSSANTATETSLDIVAPPGELEYFISAVSSFAPFLLISASNDYPLFSPTIQASWASSSTAPPGAARRT